MKLAEALSRNLKCLVAEHDMNIAQMSKELRISRTNMHRYMNGDAVPGLNIAWLIAEYFGVSLDELIEGTDRCERSRRCTLK